MRYVTWIVRATTVPMATPINFGSAVCRSKCYDNAYTPTRDAAFKTVEVNNLTTNCLVSCSSTVPGGDLGPSIEIPVGQSLFVDATTGDDTTALPYRFDLMYATVRAALDAAVAGDTVYIYPGEYDETSDTLFFPFNVDVVGMKAPPVASSTPAAVGTPSTVTITALTSAVGSPTQSYNTVSNIRVNAPPGLPAFVSGFVPFFAVRGIVYWVGCTLAESVDGGGGPQIPTIDMKSNAPLNCRDCVLLSTRAGGSQSSTPIISLSDAVVANLEQCTVDGVIVNGDDTFINVTETSFVGYDSMTLRGTLGWRDCRMRGLGNDGSDLTLSCRLVAWNNVSVEYPSVSISSTGVVAVPPTYSFTSCVFQNGFIITGTDTISVNANGCVFNSVFLTFGVSGDMVFSNNVFSDMIAFDIEHAVLGGGRYRFYRNSIVNSEPITIAQFVASTAAANPQSMVFSENQVSIAAITLPVTSSIVYLLNGVADNGVGADALHVFTNNTFGYYEPAPRLRGNSIEALVNFLSITSSGNVSLLGFGGNLLVTTMTID